MTAILTEKFWKTLQCLLIMAFLCFESGQQTYSQVKAPQLTPLSPNAASLWKYAELPVDLYTGIPSISIPLYEIQSGSLKLPISLNYHAGGIRYEDQASWVGLGFNLSAGGAINRNVKGLADEKGILYSGSSFLTNATNCSYEYFLNVLNRVHDTQADEFSFNMPGKSGRFLFSPITKQPITLPYAPIQIGYDYTYGSLSNIRIVDEQGLKYSFNATETTSGGAGVYVEELFPSTWMLTQIQSADLAKAITLNYSSGTGYVQKNTKTDYISVVDDAQGNSNEASVCQPPNTSISPPTSTNLTYNTTTRYLSEILFDNGKVEFVQSSVNRTDIYENQKALEFIRIYSLVNGTYTLIKSIQFHYSYFQKLNNSTLVDYKLKLDKIQVLGADASVHEEYSFQYHTTTFSGYLNDANDKNALDWWGYYNGKTTNTSLIPQQTITVVTGGSSIQQTIGGADRDTYPTFMTEGVLKRITYPTKGYTEFEFESNQYDEGGLKYAGGLRVKKIISLASANDVPIIKTYKYGQGNTGYGKKLFFNYKGNYASERFTKCVQTLFTVGNINYRQRTYNSMSSLQIDGYDGSPVVYPYVTEFVGTETVNNGRTEYVFDNGSPTSDNVYLSYSATTSVLQRQSNHYLRGHLTNKAVFSAEGNLVLQVVTDYATLHPIEETSGLSVYRRLFYSAEEPFACAPDLGMDRFSYFYYPVRSGINMPVSVIEKTANPSDFTKFITTETSFEYDVNYLVPTTVTKSYRKLQTGYEEQTVEYNKYPFSYTFGGTPSGAEAEGIKFLQNKNISIFPIEKLTVKKSRNPDTWSSEVIAGIVTSYKNNNPYPDKIWQLEITAPVALTTFGAGTSIVSNSFSKNSNYKEQLAFSDYDPAGNILQFNKTSDISNAFLWDYSNQYVTAEVTNASGSDIAYASFETDNKGYWAYSGVPSTDNSAPTGTKSYQLTGTNNIIRSGLSSAKSYLVSYWINGSSPLTIGGTVGTVMAGRQLGTWKHYQHLITGVTEVTLTGSTPIDEIRLHPSDALMTTYTYKPLIGITTKNNPQNQIQYYEYDNVGRLELIKDLDKNVLQTFEYKYKTP